MTKVLHVAVREFVATVLTKGFIFGILFPPLLIAIVLAAMPLLMNKASPKVAGHIAVIDHSGKVAPRLTEAFSRQALADRKAKRAADVLAAAPIAPPTIGPGAAGVNLPGSAETELALRVLPPDTDLEQAKAAIRQSDGKNTADSDTRLALAVIPVEAVTQAQPPASLKGFELFVAPKLDLEVRGDIQGQIRDAIVDARIEAAGLDVPTVRALTARPEASTKAITSQGEKKGAEVAQLLIPAAFMFLLWISVFTCGQYLLSSTIEEKSNRVMEVLLSAVSPIELMAGKIVGQMWVGALIMALYGGAGVSALIGFAMSDFIEWINLVYLAVYFIIAFSLIACMMAAVGSAVNDVREAQSLLGPVMIVLIIPMILWMPILRNPNSVFAQVCSFIPPVSPFVMVLRIAGSEPIPFWQIPATMITGALSVALFLWASAKIFRIGVLMYGKPPNFLTLLRWVKMA